MRQAYALFLAAVAAAAAVPDLFNFCLLSRMMLMLSSEAVKARSAAVMHLTWHVATAKWLGKTHSFIAADKEGPSTHEQASEARIPEALQVQCQTMSY